MAASSSDEGLAAKFAVLLPHLDERQRRLLLGAEARELERDAATLAGIRETEELVAITTTRAWRTRLSCALFPT